MPVSAGKDPVERLISRFEKWLVVQPEYPLIFLADRTLRRQVSRELAHRFTTIPKRADVVAQEEKSGQD